MATLEHSETSQPRQIPVAAPRAGRWENVERALVWLGDRVNPILVKETRQALKSRQFVVTFTLVLLLAWAWSIFGVSMIGPSIYYAARGFDLFQGYYVILAVPLMVIVPFGAFRSLASEREDGTYELLSITTLRPRQIVGGKLGSAMLQMLVYFSAIAPCLAFTYMLKGIDVPTILYVLYYSFIGSLGLSVIGLVVATLTPEKHWQIVLSVVFLFGLATALWSALALVMGALPSAPPAFQDRVFWIVNAIIQTAYWGYFVLFYCAAAAQLTFASDNRSTRLRQVMIVHQALLTGWVVWGFVEAEGQLAIVIIYFMLSGIHWVLMGMFLNGEVGDISLRVKRQLPQTFLGRAFFTWFNPGPATGWMFVVANLLATLLIGAALSAFGYWVYPNQLGPMMGSMPHVLVVAFGFLEFAYIVAYLGLGRLAVALVRRFSPVTVSSAVSMQLLLVLAGSGIPLSVHWMMPDIRRDYSLLEITNPFYSLYEVMEVHDFIPEVVALMILVPLAAAGVALMNLPGVVAAVRQVRLAKPRRVEEEDLQEAALRAPPTGPSSPFDDVPVAT